MVRDRDDARTPSILGATLKTVVAIGLLSYGASVWLSGSTLDQNTMSRLAAATSRGVEDPLTTGSLAGAAGAVKLDPCTAPRR